MMTNEKLAAVYAARRAELDAAEKRAVAALNAIAGARELLAALQAELDKPEPVVIDFPAPQREAQT